MTAVYRFRAAQADFSAVGRLEQADGMFVVVAAVSVDQAALLDEHQKGSLPIQILVQVGDAIVAIMPVHKIRVGERGRGQRVELWAMIRP